MGVERFASWQSDFPYTTTQEVRMRKVKDHYPGQHDFQSIFEISLPRNIARVHVGQQNR